VFTLLLAGYHVITNLACRIVTDHLHTVILGFRPHREFWPNFFFLLDIYMFER
jgi:hypothetical protein